MLSILLYFMGMYLSSWVKSIWVIIWLIFNLKANFSFLKNWRNINSKSEVSQAFDPVSLQIEDLRPSHRHATILAWATHLLQPSWCVGISVALMASPWRRRSSSKRWGIPMFHRLTRPMDGVCSRKSWWSQCRRPMLSVQIEWLAGLSSSLRVGFLESYNLFQRLMPWRWCLFWLESTGPRRWRSKKRWKSVQREMTFGHLEDICRVQVLVHNQSYWLLFL